MKTMKTNTLKWIPIAPSNVRVVVDTALMETELPYPTEELRTTIHAVGSYIQWPQVLLLPVSVVGLSPYPKGSLHSGILGRSGKKKEKLTLPGLLKTIYHIASQKKEWPATLQF